MKQRTPSPMLWNGQHISPRELCRTLGFSYRSVLAECFFNNRSFRAVICRRIAQTRRRHSYQYCLEKRNEPKL
jgi:hypothetical protein